MGPLMIDVHGTELTKEDAELIAHPLVGGLILFTRNYESPRQLAALTTQIQQAKKNNILIAVDHEGGRVQRFREHFTLIPAMGELISLAQNDYANAENLACLCGELIALEVQAVGIDISFAPVLDLDRVSQVIGKRGFASDPAVVVQLAKAFIAGMNKHGMRSTGKHFPGHGSVVADSHIDLPRDERSFDEIYRLDMQPFIQLISQNLLDAIMPAHVIYPEVDDKSVGFSPYWLRDILRKKLGFNGVIFSDDLSMEGASSVGGYVERCEAAQSAGCDMLLVCNNRNASELVLDKANIEIIPQSSQRIASMLSSRRLKSSAQWSELRSSQHWQSLTQQLANYLPQ